MDPGELRVVVTDGRGRPARAPGLASWLRRAAPVKARGTVCVAIVSDDQIRALNRTYRRKDTSTDVLSFPAESGARGGVAARSHLGDIVIGRGVARAQARARAHGAAVELRILALHGLLHLLGYDHHGDGGRMRRVEQRLLRKAGVREGLIARAHGSTSSPRALHSVARPERVEGRANR